MKKLLMLLIAIMAISGLFAALLNESFSGTTFPPDGWTVQNVNGGNTWVRNTSATYYRTAPACATILYNATAHNDWLITPKLVPATGNSTFAFYAKYYSSYVERFNVKLSTTGNAVGDFTVDLALNVAATAAYSLFSYDLSPYIGSNVYIAIQAISADQWYLQIDDVTGPDIYVPPVPPNAATSLLPADLAGGIQTNATMSWATGGGGPDGYKFYYGTSAPPVSAADFPITLPLATTSYTPYPVLAPGTVYYWAVAPYNAYGYAPFTTMQFTTGAGMVYPTSTATSTEDDDIGQFILGTFANPETAPESLLNNAASNQMYNDYTAMGPIDIRQGGAYPVSITQINSGSFYACYAKVFIDYNQNGAFEVPGEVAFEGATTSLINPLTGTINVPLGALLGTTRLRVVLRESGTTATTLPTGTYSWGETEDYTVNIMEPLAGVPEAVTLGNPANGITIPKVGYPFTWAPGGGGTPTGYDLYLASETSEDVTSDYLHLFSNVTSPFVVSSAYTLAYETTYQWTVVPYNTAEGPAATPRLFTVEDDPAIVLPHTQYFADAAIPGGWTQTFSGGVTSNRWSLSATAIAGGAANEMIGSYTSGIGVSRLITPPVNTTGVTNLNVGFRSFINDYGTGWTYKFQYSNDLSTWYDTGWSYTGAGNVSVGPTMVSLNMLDYNAPVTYFAWMIDGDHYQLDYVYVDDFTVREVPTHDVGAVSWDMNEVYPAAEIIPKATVGNFGLNTETFTVSLNIGVGYSDIQTVTDLAPGTTVQVTFDPYLPVVNYMETVAITTLLGTDVVPANDYLEKVLVCLPLDTIGLANNAQTDRFVSFNLATPGIHNVMPTVPIYGANFMSGSDWVNGEWMGVEYWTVAGNDDYWNIHPTTGAMEDRGDLGVLFMGNAYDENHDVMYAVTGTSGELYTMHPGTGAPTLVAAMWYQTDEGPIPFAGATGLNGLMIDCAYDNTNNILYGIDLGNDYLFTIDPTTAEVVDVGPFGIDLNYAQGASFDQANGLLFLAAYAGVGGLYWVDTFDGAAYKVGDFLNGYELDGFAIPYGDATDTPAPVISGAGTLSWAPIYGAAGYNVYSADDPYGTYNYVTTVYGTSWTDPVPADKKFYKVTAVGGRAVSQAQPMVRNSTQKKAKISSSKPANAGLAPRF